MSELYLSNATTQKWTFRYRELRGTRATPASQAYTIFLHPGGQKTIQCDPDKKAYIIEQLEAAGAHDAAEVHRRVSKFHGLMYRDGGQISGDEIMMGHDSVQVMQKDRSVEQAVTSALAADRATNPVRGQRRTKSTVIEVEQALRPGQRPTGNEVAFSLAVDTEEGGTKLVNRAVA